jgi:chromosome segregation ATPase
MAENDPTSEPLTVVEFEDISHSSSDAEAAAAEAANAVAIAVSTAVAESEAAHAAKLNELQSSLDAERAAHAQTRLQLDQFREQHNQHNVHLLADMLQSQLTAARAEAERASSSQRALMQRCRTLEESYAELQRNSDDTARKLNARATAAANSIRDIQAERERMKVELDEQRYAIMYGDTEKDREIDRLRSTITETQTVLGAFPFHLLHLVILVQLT